MSKPVEANGECWVEELDAGAGVDVTAVGSTLHEPFPDAWWSQTCRLVEAFDGGGGG